jgi:hypothetical protein
MERKGNHGGLSADEFSHCEKQKFLRKVKVELLLPPSHPTFRDTAKGTEVTKVKENQYFYIYCSSAHNSSNAKLTLVSIHR